MPLCMPFRFTTSNLLTVSGAPPWALLDAPDLTARVTTYEQRVADGFGYESATLGYDGDVWEAVWALNLLGRVITVTGPYGPICWEGLVHEVKVSANGVDHSLSLEQLANRVLVRFTSILGYGGAKSLLYQDTDSQARYGIKDYIQSGGAGTRDEANYLAARILAQRAQPPSATAISLRTQNPRTACQITLSCVGLYETLGWCVTANSSTSTSSTTTQAAALLSATPNAWITAGDIVSSGRNASAFMAEDTTYRAKIEELLGLGTSSDQPLSWGVYANRLFNVAIWAGEDVGTMPIRTYRTTVAEPVVRDAENAPVNWWDVLPNRAYSSDLLNVGANATNVGGVVGRASFTCDQQGMSLQLEGSQRSSIDAIVARMR